MEGEQETEEDNANREGEVSAFLEGLAAQAEMVQHNSVGSTPNCYLFGRSTLLVTEKQSKWDEQSQITANHVASKLIM